jgi:hypothetical protein
MFRSILIVPLALGLTACKELPGPIDELCDLGCPVEGIAAGNASISGIASVDSFFAAVVGFGKAALEVRAGVDAELRAIAVSLELDAGASAGEIKAALAAKLDAAVDGGLKIAYAPPRCTVDAKVAVDAAAKCDAEIDPGKAQVECKGACTVDASAGASCEADATVVCRGTAPDLKCDGTCTGTCQLAGEFKCEGICNGECTSGCSVVGADGQCAGECTGQCMGSCELRAGATCDGQCEGTCEYTPPGGQCEAGAEVRCQASAEASATCEGTCDGEVVPPKAKAECEASVEADAKLRAECTPPTLEIKWQWKASFSDPQAQAEFKAWVEGFRGRYAGLLAATARAELVIDAGAGIVASASGLVETLPGEFDIVNDPRAAIGIPCALTQLEAVATVVGDGSAALSASVSAVAEVSGAIAGG